MIDAQRFLELFPPGRRNAFGQHDGKRAFTVKSTPTPFVVRQHLQGKSRLGLYPLDAEGRASWAVIDLDDAGVSAVKEITKAAQKWGLRLAVERSKSKGWHLWFFFSEAVPAVKARTTLQGVIHAAGWGKWNFEIFPKQSQIKSDAFGNYLFMPWNGHSVKEDRTVFIDTTKDPWPPVPDQADYIRQFPRYAERDLDKIIQTKNLKLEQLHQVEKADADNGDARPSGMTDLPLPPCAAKIYQEGTASPGRSDWAHFIARHFRRRGLPEEAAVRLLLDWNQKNRPEPLPPDKIASMVRTAYTKKYTSLGCEYLPAAKAICGDTCPVKIKETRVAESHEAPEPEVIRLADVRAEKIEWLWSGRLPRGKFIIVLGDPGLGKSTVCIDIMARVTIG
ncbi:MAG: AAA family ATPase, partial [Gemmatimonadales bacterium]